MEDNNKQHKILIFLPKIVTKADFLYLIGEIDKRDDDKTEIYFVTKSSQEKPEKSCIGIWSKASERKKINSNFVEINEKDGKILIKAEENISKILILYDSVKFCDYNIEKPSEDLFVVLQNKLTREKPTFNATNQKLVRILEILCQYFLILMPILKFSSTALQLKETADRFLWALTAKNIKARNFFFSVLFDVILGLFILRLLLTITTSSEFPDLFLWVSEQCVNGLRSLLQWLAGSPAGFKLNQQLNNILAKFFLFYTEIWWIFLVLISPALGVIFKLFMFLGQFGFTLQAAILSDILALVSFHAYCIYAFAARLYYIQLSGLISLWRLFLGRKWNPLRDKVDSCQYSAEQLFVGTLVFTILLFLLPTSLIYYVVFTTMRLFLVIIGGILTRIRKLLHAVPVYSTFLWLTGASCISTQIRMEWDVKLSSTGNANFLKKFNSLLNQETMVFNATRVPDSYLTTVKNTTPDFVEIAPTEAGKLIQILLTGQLLCPV